jgi:methyltransferase (TIGR00027 family)
MESGSMSTTALITALMRAVHGRQDPHPVLDDHWGDRLVPPAALEALGRHKPPQGDDEADPKRAVDDWLRASPAYANVIVRSRYTEDSLHASVARGVRQYVLVGAGFDSYTLRIPEVQAPERIFEVDHPATQAFKQQRLAECDLEAPECVEYIAVDLAEETLAGALSNSSFDFEQPAFFSWLGVTMYLTQDANRAALADIARCGAPGSELVFSYVDQVLLAPSSTPESAAFEQVRRTVAASGEPFVSGFDPGTLAVELSELGLELAEDLSDTELIERYDPSGRNGMVSSAQSRVARATISGG